MIDPIESFEPNEVYVLRELLSDESCYPETAIESVLSRRIRHCFDDVGELDFAWINGVESLLSKGLLQVVDDEIRRVVRSRVDPATVSRRGINLYAVDRFQHSRPKNGAVITADNPFGDLARLHSQLFNYPGGDFGWRNLTGIGAEGELGTLLESYATRDYLACQRIYDRLSLMCGARSIPVVYSMEWPVAVGPIQDFWWRTPKPGFRVTIRCRKQPS